MNLNDFIARAAAYFDKAEKSSDTKIAEQASRIAEFESKLADTEAAIAERDEKIKTLGAQLEPQAVKIKTLESELAKEKEKAIETLAGLGVKPEDIPAGQEEKKAEQPNPMKQWLAINDPAERVKFYRANREAIDSMFKN